MHTFSTTRSAARARRSGLALALFGAAIAWPAGVLLAADAQDASQPSTNVYANSAQLYAPYQGDGEIHPFHAQGQVWLMAGEPGLSNVAAQIGNEGVLVVDTGLQSMAGKLVAQIKQLAARSGGDQLAIRYVVDTDGSLGHIGGNAAVREAGSTVVAGNFARDNPGLTPGAQVLANQNVLMRLVAESASGYANAAPQELWPSDTEDFDIYNTSFNGEAVQLIHPHNATSDGNLVVMFRRSDVISTGDIVDETSYPHIDTARGGTIDGELVALNHIIDMAVPEDKEQGGTMIIPGYGRLADQADVVYYKNVMTTIRNRVQYYKNQGKTLQQVLAIKPSWDWDARWGHDNGPWTTSQFITAIYKTLPTRGPSFSMRNETVVPGTTGTATSGGKVY